MNIVYLQLATGLAANAFTLSYERVLNENVSVSIGGGYGILTFMDAEEEAFGAEALVHFFVGGVSKFEFAVGTSIFAGDCNDFTVWCPEAHDQVAANPAVFIGYRYQPEDNVFFKAGLAWSMVYGLPFGLALGRTF